MSTRTLPLLGEVELNGGVSIIAILIGIVVIALVPQFTGSYWTNIGIDVMILALWAISYNLLFGYTGMLSFGHTAYYGAAAYVVALALAGSQIVPQVGSFIPALALGIVGAVILAAVFGAIAVQRGGVFFAMLTLALNMMVYELVFQASELTGGANGTTLPPTEINLGFASFSVLSTGMYFYFTLALVALSLLVVWRVVNSPYGELLRAIRENPERAEFIGMNVKLYQWSAFVIAGLFAGLAGGLVSVQQFVVAPNVLHWSTGATPLLATLLGGPTTFLGPVLGSVIFVMLEEVLTSVTEFWEVAIGLILIPIVLFLPGGILGYLLGEGGLSERIGGGSGDVEGDG